MKKIFAAGSVFLIIAFYAVSGWAAVIDFEDIQAGKPYGDLPTGYAGFNWSTYLWHYDPYILQIQYPEIVGSGYDLGVLEHKAIFTAYCMPGSMSAISGKFNFEGAYITSAWRESEDVIVEGWSGGSLMYSRTVTTHNDAPYWFDFDFNNFDKVIFNPGEPPGCPSRGHLVIDNIKTSTVPEPATMALFGIGGLVTAFARRKKRG